MTKVTVLSVDDDEGLQMVVGHYLEEDGYNVIKAQSAAELETVLDKPIDVILLDLLLPDAQGFTLIPKIRAKTQAPIIIVSGKSDTTEKIVGLELGADDYITKPFELRELTARIKAVVRRAVAPSIVETPVAANTSAAPKEKIFFGNFCLDRLQYQLFDREGKSMELTSGEFRLLEALVLSPNRVLTRDYLYELTRDGEFDAYDRAVDIQIGRIRKKIGDDPKTPEVIKTVRGVGYMFCAVKEEN